jgi:hypothetical protein
MGRFAEIAIVKYRLLYANQGKQISCFPFPFAANKRKFAIFIFHFQQTNGIAVLHYFG